MNFSYTATRSTENDTITWVSTLTFPGTTDILEAVVRGQGMGDLITSVTEDTITLTGAKVTDDTFEQFVREVNEWMAF